MPSCQACLNEAFKNDTFISPKFKSSTYQFLAPACIATGIKWVFGPIDISKSAEYIIMFLLFMSLTFLARSTILVNGTVGVLIYS